MNLPLISHPTRDEQTETYADAHLTQIGDLRLDAHCRVVAQRAIRLFGASAAESGEESFLTAAAALHDFGKATPQFQAYVRPDGPREEPSEETAHARLGALASWYVLGELGASDRDRLAGTLAVARHHQAIPNASRYTAGVLAKALEEHDGAIRAQLDAIDEQWPDAAEELFKQAGLTDPDWEAFYEWATSGTPAEGLRELSADKVFESLDFHASYLPSKLYDRTLRYWSAITLADKSHAMDIREEKVFDLDTLDRGTIEAYIQEMRSDPPENELEARLNDDRERARRQAIRGVHQWVADDESAIATLTLPTGLGKTFSGLSAAFETRDLLAQQGESDSDRPIIYALPYTSIIEQTREIFEDPDLWGADPEKSALTVHHYLSQTLVQHGQFDDTDVTETDEETAMFLGEAWRDGTILTTFVQLFESLAGPTNSQGLKLPALRESIIILDEPQALPKDWWDGIERLLDLLVEEYDARILAMTATQPSLVENLQTASLLDAGQQHEQDSCAHCQAGRDYETALQPAEKETYYETAQRVRFTIDETALSKQLEVEESHIGYGEASRRVLDATDADGSTLAVCNTISSSRELTSELDSRSTVTHLGTYIESVLTERDINAVDVSSGEESVDVDVDEIVDAVLDQFHEETKSSDRTALLTLNSRYRPFDRETLIEIADRLSTGEVPFVLVSTQAIEAGVDLSFRTVFRDLAPVDSIVQAAGRCNRSYEWGEEGGRVEVWLLADPDEETPGTPSSSPPAYYVYEKKSDTDSIPSHLRLISSVLSEIPNREDASEAVVSRDAVRAYFQRLSENSLWSGELREAIDDANGQCLGQQSLINGHETRDVVVTVSDSDQIVVEELSEHLANGNPEGYDELENAAPLRVSLPKSVIEETPRLNRVDKQNRNSDGVDVFEFFGYEGLEYDLTRGGLYSKSDTVGDRFTT